MGFKCPNCNKDFGIDKDAFDTHIRKCSPPFFKQEDFFNIYKRRKAKAPSLNAIKQAAEDGRLEVWVNWDGFIVIRNTHTGRQVELECSRNYDGEHELKQPR